MAGIVHGKSPIDLIFSKLVEEFPKGLFFDALCIGFQAKAVSDILNLFQHDFN